MSTRLWAGTCARQRNGDLVPTAQKLRDIGKALGTARPIERPRDVSVGSRKTDGA